jgi:hypothetical protein
MGKGIDYNDWERLEWKTTTDGIRIVGGKYNG